MLPPAGSIPNVLLTMDRLPEWDERNDEYPVTAVLGAAAGAGAGPAQWRPRITLNQGREGACVGHAFTHELIANPAVWEFKLMPVLRSRATEQAAAEQFAQWIYWDAQKRDRWPGGEYPGARPRMYGTSLLAGAKVLRAAGYIDGYHWARTVDELEQAVSLLGPAILGCSWYRGMQVPDRAGFIRATGRIVGGHAICVTGVDPAAGWFEVTNSWGPQWGSDSGRARIPYDDMELLLRGRGEAVVPTGRVEQKARR